MIRRTTALAVAAAALGCANARPAAAPLPAHVTTLQVTARDGLGCRAFFASDHEPVRDVVLWMGGTGTRSSAFLPDDARALLAARNAAFVTFDKPGMTATFGDPDAVRIDDAALMRHTQGTILDCAREALATSRRIFPSAVRFHLRGHSEGALVALYLADELGDPSGIASLTLTGTPLAPFRDILKRQLDATPALARAVTACEPKAMRALGVSCAYLDDAARRPSGFATIEHLAKVGFHAPIAIYQGTHDENVAAADAERLARWNETEGHLALTVTMFEGGHGGTAAAKTMVRDRLFAVVPP